MQPCPFIHRWIFSITRKHNHSAVRFPQTFTDDLKRQADIVRVLRDYVRIG